MEATMELISVPIDKPDDLNLILGAVALHQDLRRPPRGLGRILAASAVRSRVLRILGPRLVRRSGNDDELVELATRNALAIGAGHSFLVFMREGFPVNVLNQVKHVPEVCRVFCATANPVEVIVTEASGGRAILGVVDGGSPLGVETDDDVTDRKQLLRTIGYKL